MLKRYKKKWSQGLKLENMEENEKENEDTLKHLSSLATQYNKLIQDEIVKTKQELVIANVGKIDPKRHLSEVLNLN